VVPFSGIELVVFEENGLRITAWHPILRNNLWIFPQDCLDNKKVTLEKFYCDFVYNFVLDDGHVICINNIECVTLGHSFDDNDVVKHPFFGSPLVIEHLQRFTGWSAGLIEISSSSIIRHHKSGLICGLQPTGGHVSVPQQEYPSFLISKLNPVCFV